MKKSKIHRILGVDPGTNVLGYAVIEVRNKDLHLIEIGVITMAHLESQQMKLKKIFERLQAIINNHQPQQMAIEAPFFGKNVQSMLKLGRAQGVAMVAGVTMGLDVTEYSPKKIKQSVTGNGNASKEQVAAMLTNILGKKLDEQELDATDALGAAVCHHFQGNSLLSKGKRYNDWSGFITDNPDRTKK